MERLAGGVGAVTEDLNLLVVQRRVGVQQSDTGRSVRPCAASSLGQLTYGDQTRLGLDRDVGLEPILATVDGLVRVPGFRIDHADHPVLRDVPGHPPAAVGASESSAGSTSCPVSSARSATVRDCYASSSTPSSSASSASTSFTKALTDACRASLSSQAIRRLPGSS